MLICKGTVVRTVVRTVGRGLAPSMGLAGLGWVKIRLN